MTLSLGLSVQESSGLWLDLNDGVRYIVAANSFESYSQSWRRVMVTSPYMEGSYQVHALPENGVESVTVYCHGATYSEALANAYIVTAAFSQPFYKVTRSISGGDQTWNCLTADYAVKTSNAMAASNMCIVEIQVPRLPTFTTTINPADQFIDGGTPTTIFGA